MEKKNEINDNGCENETTEEHVGTWICSTNYSSFTGVTAGVGLQVGERVFPVEFEAECMDLVWIWVVLNDSFIIMIIIIIALEPNEIPAQFKWCFDCSIRTNWYLREALWFLNITFLKLRTFGPELLLLILPSAKYNVH